MKCEFGVLGDDPERGCVSVPCIILSQNIKGRTEENHQHRPSGRIAVCSNNNEPDEVL
jgi:hypothetical protein